MPKKYLLFKGDGSRYEFDTYKEFYDITLPGEWIPGYKLFKGEVPIDLSPDNIDYIWKTFDAKNRGQIMAVFSYAEQYIPERPFNSILD